MTKESINISLDADLKKQSQALYSDLGIDLSTAVTIFLKQSLRAQGFPFSITREVPNAETIAAMNEYHIMKVHPELYKRFRSIDEFLKDVLDDA